MTVYARAVEYFRYLAAQSDRVAINQYGQTYERRPLINLVETCLILGSVFFATGLLGEQIAVQRAELRELRRQIDVLRARRDG